ncbi:MAG: hypothetical protein KDB23_23695, partial [Planctomycetales bacterium]|nr:hypothetical protein [Planctomycetales bacterium]
FSAGLLLGVFALGTLTQRVGQVATSIGLLTGLATLSYVAFLSDWGLAWPWFALLGCVITFLTALLVHGLGRTRRYML